MKGEAGAMNERVTIQSKTQTADGIGGFVTGWADMPSVPTVWANVTAMGGREAIDAARQGASTMYKITIRNRSDVDELCRIVWRGDNMNIRQIKREGVHSLYLEIMAERGENT